MTPDQVVIVSVVLLLVFLVARVPVAMSLIVASAVGIWLLDGTTTLLANLGQVPFSATARYTLAVVPLFVLMGIFARHARMGTDVYDLVSRYLAWLPGGIGVATVSACAAFAAVSGSSVATVVTVGRISMQEMRRFGYPDYLAAGIIACAGTLGVLIPPSIMLVIYGIVAGVSVGQLLIAGIIPGVMTAFAYIAWIMILGRKLISSPSAAVVQAPTAVPATPPADRNVPLHAATPAVQLGTVEHPDVTTHQPHPGAVATVFSIGRIAVVFGVIIGGIYFGVVTTTEAAALGAVATLVFLLVEVARGRVRLRVVTEALRETSSLLGMVFLLFIGASLFAFLLVASGTPRRIAESVTELSFHPMLIIIGLLLVFIPIGMFLDGISTLLILIPLMTPLVVELGYSPLWFGILAIKMIEIGLVTPPVGLNAFALVGAVKDLTLSTTFKGIMLILPMELVMIAVLLIFPETVLWLPRTLGFE